MKSGCRCLFWPSLVRSGPTGSACQYAPQVGMVHSSGLGCFVRILFGVCFYHSYLVLIMLWLGPVCEPGILAQIVVACGHRIWLLPPRSQHGEVNTWRGGGRASVQLYLPVASDIEPPVRPQSSGGGSTCRWFSGSQFEKAGRKLLVLSEALRSQALCLNFKLSLHGTAASKTALTSDTCTLEMQLSSTTARSRQTKCLLQN